MDEYSIYLHIPFCRHRCAYCDFNTYAGQEARLPVYMDALIRELELVSRAAGQRLPVATIFFGGGTPSLLPVSAVERVLATIVSCFDLQADAEISMEANPGTVTLANLRSLRSLGVNRLSFGVQSAHPADLLLLERQHDYLDVIQAVAWSRAAGFDNLSLDLIFGLPSQPLQRWQETVELVLGLQPDHLSLYALTIEHGTPFFHWAERGLVSTPDDDLAADMYDWAAERLSRAGFEQYEISNWAGHDRSGQPKVCRHNLQYWHNRPYLGFGAGAHGFAGGVRTANLPAIPAYSRRCLDGQPGEFPVGPAAANVIRVDPKEEMQETMMVGLRLTQEGVSASDFERRFGQPVTAVFPTQIRQLTYQGLLEWSGENLRLTPRGRLLGNRVFREFVGPD